MKSAEKRKAYDDIASDIRKCDKQLADIQADQLVSWADDLAFILADAQEPDIKKRKGLNTAQIRRFLSAVMETQVSMIKGDTKSNNKLPNEAPYLKVYLAYAQGRHPKVKPLLEVMIPIIDKVASIGEGEQYKKNFNILSKFVQSVVAYHRYYGGE